MNRYVRLFLFGGIFSIVFIFVFPLFFRAGREDYYRTVTFLIPIAIALFILPTASYTLKKWDIRFNFIKHDDRFRIAISNLGDTPFNFNRVAFASSPKYFLLGKRDYYPTNGMFDNDIELHGAETPSRVLHEHIGYTVKLGMPITIWIRPKGISDYLKHFKNRKKIRLCIYFEGTNQIEYSKPIPVEIIKRYL